MSNLSNSKQTSDGASWQTFGHQNIKNILTKQIASGKIPHAYLFTGPKGVGKKTLALEFAKQAIGTENLGSHPDFQILDIDGEITMDRILEFISRASFKPIAGNYKLAIINNAENLNQQSSNALLKTLEEPALRSIVILIAGLGRLLPTIVSRCQSFTFHDLSEDELKQFVNQKGLAVTPEALALSFGSPARLLNLIENKDFLAQEIKIAEEFDAISTAKLAEKLLSVSKYAELEPEKLEQIFTAWIFRQKSALSNRPKEYAKIKSLTQALLGLKANFNKKMVLQSLFLKI